jgi:hypothetical protein
MANTRLYTRSFAGGEVSPEMFGRIDDSRYQTGAKTMRNFVVKPQGAARSRPGFEYVANTKFSDKPTRLIPFVFNNDQAYALEFGEQYMRIYLNGAQVQLSGVRAFVANATVTFDNSLDVVNWSANGLQNGDAVIFSGGTMPPELASNILYYVVNAATNTIQLTETVGGSPITFTLNGSPTVTGKRRYYPGEIFSSGGSNYYCTTQNDGITPPSASYWSVMSGNALEIPTPYDDADVMDLHYVQSGDILTIVHPSYAPREVARYSAQRWTCTEIAFQSRLQPPATLTAHKTYGARFQVYSIDTVGAGTPTQFALLSNSVHYFAIGSFVYITGATGGSPSDSIPDGFYIVHTTPNAYTFTLRYRDTGTIVSKWPSSPIFFPTSCFVQASSPSIDVVNSYCVTAFDKYGIESAQSTLLEVNNNLFQTGAANTIAWQYDPEAYGYNVYKKQSGLFGYIGQTTQMRSPQSKFLVYTISGGSLGIIKSGFILYENEAVAFSAVPSGAVIPTGVTAGQAYFVKNTSPTSFTVSEVPGGDPIVVSGATPNGFTVTRLASFTDDNIAPDLGRTPSYLDDADDFVGTGNYPSAVSYFEQRRIFAGTNNDPQTFWGTRANTESDLGFHIPVQADDRIKFKVASRQASQIRHLVALNNLLALTSQAEWRITSIDSDALTPTTASVRPQSYIGANNVQPQIVNNSLLYCASRGGHVREIGYNWQQQSYTTGDVSLRAAHLFDSYDLTDMAFSKAPQPIVWFISTSGNLLGFTYIPEEQVGAWHWHDTDGEFLSVCAIPEGEEDRLYAVIRRGASQFVERMDAFEFTDIKSYVGLDCSLSFDGTEPNNSHHVHISGGTNWTPSETLTLTMSHNHFAYPATTDVGDQIVVYDASGEEYRLTILATSSATVATAKPNKTIPLSLRTVAIYGWAWARNSFSGLGHLNGFTVRAFADGVALEPQVVSGGTITITNPAVHIVVGLPYTCDLETLPVAMQIDGFGQGRTKNINKAWLKVYQTAGMEIGPDADNLVPASPYENTPELKTSEIQVLMTPAWQDSGTVFVRQSDPVPTTVLGMTTEISIGG